jgi:hypothetical protein
MVEVFKTNVQHREQAEQLTSVLRNRVTCSRITFDLEDCDKVLRVEGGEICVKTVIEIVNTHGLEIEILE